MNVERDGRQIVEPSAPALNDFVGRYCLTGNVTSDGKAFDCWGHPFRIKVKDGIPEIWSCGPNGIDESGSGDDITPENSIP